MTRFLLHSPIAFALVFVLIAETVSVSSSQNLTSSFLTRDSRGYHTDSYSKGHGHGHSGGWHSGGGHGGGYGHGGGGGFQSFFDIALTGLAFLSFGTFLLNLLLNALIGAGVITGTLLPTNTGTGIITTTATSTGTGITVGRSKKVKREVPFELHLDPVTSMDALAASVLKSIDAMVHEHECVKKVFCDGNKEAKIIGSGFQYMMPAYSLGASYIGRKVGFHDSFTDHVKAVTLGLEESNCQSHFPQC